MLIDAVSKNTATSESSENVKKIKNQIFFRQYILCNILLYTILLNFVINTI